MLVAFIFMSNVYGDVCDECADLFKNFSRNSFLAGAGTFLIVSFIVLFGDIWFTLTTSDQLGSIKGKCFIPPNAVSFVLLEEKLFVRSSFKKLICYFF